MSHEGLMVPKEEMYDKHMSVRTIFRTLVLD